jgi:hypothetical protein
MPGGSDRNRIALPDKCQQISHGKMVKGTAGPGVYSATYSNVSRMPGLDDLLGSCVMLGEIADFFRSPSTNTNSDLISRNMLCAVAMMTGSMRHIF